MPHGLDLSSHEGTIHENGYSTVIKNTVLELGCLASCLSTTSHLLLFNIYLQVCFLACETRLMNVSTQ